MNLLDKALSQRTEVKIKKQKPSKNQLTKDELSTTIHGLTQIAFDMAYTLECRKEAKSAIQKLNNQLKELL